MPRIFLLDGTALAYRAHFAMARSGLTTPEGQASGATYGFAMTLRKLLETQAAMAGLKLNVVLEVSGIQSILELVEAGHGYGVLGQTALAASGRPEQFSLRPLTKPGLTSTMFLARSAHKPSTPLILQAQRLLQDLLLSSTQPSHAESR